jgi:hypothetical protein
VGVRINWFGVGVWFLSTFIFGDVMNEQIKKLAEQAGLQPYYETQQKHIERFAELVRHDERQGCAEYYLKIMRDAVARERQACFDLVYNHEDTYHHFGLCKRAAELIKQRGELAEPKLEWQELYKDEVYAILNDGEEWTAIEFAQAVSDLLKEKNT